jgi:hypothetical protein
MSSFLAENMEKSQLNMRVSDGKMASQCGKNEVKPQH